MTASRVFDLAQPSMRELRHLPDLTGTWGYHAGVDGTLTMSGSKRLLAITATGGGSSATMTINGGDTITIPANMAITIAPHVQLTDPEIIFTSTVAYFVEYLT